MSASLTLTKVPSITEQSPPRSMCVMDISHGGPVYGHPNERLANTNG
jgi:hypothetical protein